MKNGEFNFEVQRVEVVELFFLERQRRGNVIARGKALSAAKRDAPGK
jgi:hypothetical protein